jgi:hypothetical protein
MKKTAIFVLILIAIGGFVWLGREGNKEEEKETESTKSVSTEKVSDKLSSYRNDELGFAVNYPTTWDIENTPGKVIFLIPRELDPKSPEATSIGTTSTTIGRLEATIEIISGKCAFPPITTIDEKSSITAGKSGDIAFDMISMKNTVQSRTYFNRMYSTPKGSICYIFTYSSLVSAPASKGVATSDIPKIQSANTAVSDMADKAFTEMVKSFGYVTIEGGQNEADYKP